MYKFRGHTYNKIQTLVPIVNVDYTTITKIIARAEKKGVTFEEELEKYLRAREEKIRSLTLFNNYFRTNFTEMKQAKDYLSSKGVTTFILSASKLNLESITRLVIYAHKYNYMWLVTNGKNFKYNGLDFSSCLKFYSYYRVVNNTLLRNILNNDGDLKKAILVCRDDPGYRESGEIILNGVKYSNLKEASIKLGFSPTFFRKKTREGYSVDEAFELATNTKKPQFSFDDIFPNTINGKYFDSINEFVEDLTIAKNRVYVLLNDGKSLEYIYNSYQDNPITIINGVKCYNYSDVGKIFGMSSDSIAGLIKKYKFTLDETVSFILSRKVVYKGKEYYTHKNLAKDLGLDASVINIPYYKINKLSTQEEKDKELKRIIEYALKVKEFTKYKGTEFSSITDMQNILGIKAATMINYINKANNYKEFEELIEGFLNRRRNREITYDNKKYNSIHELEKYTGVSWHTLNKLLGVSSSTDDFTKRLKEFINSKTKD